MTSSQEAVLRADSSLNTILDRFRFDPDAPEAHYFRGANDRYGVSIPLSPSEQPKTYRDGFVFRFGISRAVKTGRITLASLDGTGPHLKDHWQVRLQFPTPMPKAEEKLEDISPHLVLDQWVVPHISIPRSGYRQPSGLPADAVQMEHLVFGQPVEAEPYEIRKLDDVLGIFQRSAEIFHATNDPNPGIYGIASAIRSIRKAPAAV